MDRRTHSTGPPRSSLGDNGVEQPFEIAKSIGAVLGAASAVGYAGGYLALHARYPLALGLHPGLES